MRYKVLPTCEAWDLIYLGMHIGIGCQVSTCSSKVFGGLGRLGMDAFLFAQRDNDFIVRMDLIGLSETTHSGPISRAATA